MSLTVKSAHYLGALLIVLALNFFLPRFMPGDPLAYVTGDPSVDMPVVMADETREKLIAYYGLDSSVGQQLGHYVASLARGDLGWSISFNAPVSEVLVGHLKWTLLLVGTATVIYVALGVTLGAVSAWKRNSKTDTTLLVSLISLGSLPSFFLGMLLILVFSARLGILPMSGAETRWLEHPTVLGHALDIGRHLILPATALVLAHLSGVYLLTRNSVLNVLGENYILAARAKGLSERHVMFRHVLRNALLPVVTMVALSVGFMVMGAIFVEIVFAYPGMGRLLYEGTVARDYPLIQGAFLVMTALVIGANLGADMLYSRLDPRVRRQ
jgi:peptide/nickel transport system permease protein